MEFGVLGPVALWRPRAAQSLTAPKLRALLALLLVEEAPVPSSQLHQLLSEHVAPESAGTTHVAVHRLRRWLDRHGGHRINRGAAGYRLEIDADLVDAGRFRRLVRPAPLGDPASAPEVRIERLVTALSLWRGPVVADAPSQLRNLAAVRRLEQIRRDATVELVELCLLTRTPDRALAIVEETAGATPYDERMQALLAMTLAACGRQVEALRLIADHRRTLADELGIEPGTHLREAQVRILRQDLVGV
jgi:DNA-binding SARP family transcriptional activator